MVSKTESFYEQSVRANRMLTLAERGDVSQKIFKVICRLGSSAQRGTKKARRLYWHGNFRSAHVLRRFNLDDEPSRELLI
jgi:hypothetical protein